MPRAFPGGRLLGPPPPHLPSRCPGRVAEGHGTTTEWPGLRPGGLEKARLQGARVSLSQMV